MIRAVRWNQDQPGAVEQATDPAVVLPWIRCQPPPASPAAPPATCAAPSSAPPASSCPAPVCPDGAATWVDVDDPRGQDAAFLVACGFHSLTIEDTQSYTSLPKLDRYPGYVFLVTHVLGYDFATRRLLAPELDLYVTAQAVVTVHVDPLPVLAEVRDRLAAHPQGTLQAGADTVLHTILDTVIDTYLPLVNRWAERFDRLEQLASSSVPSREFITRVARARRGVTGLRRQLAHQRELIEKLLNPEETLARSSLRPYYHDLVDHLARAEDMLESERERLTTILDVHLNLLNLRQAEVANEMNRAMERLAGIATIFMPLTFIVGIYGMNFDYMPELRWRWGYFVSLAGMGLISLGIFWFLRRRRLM